jgi:YD repeat-containing protein
VGPAHRPSARDHGPSGATTRATYDGLGRLVAEILPGDTAELPTTRHRYFLDGDAARPSILTEMRRISGEPDVDLVAAHLDGLGRPRLRVTQDDTGTAAILSEARIYSDAGAVAELRGRPAAPRRRAGARRHRRDREQPGPEA